ncbi:hypothetical protein CDD81_445 [Ophiocordyceps australis]|uniref:Pre-rRNA-processing protein TSR2 n=1 Tax=Ophiocordyceps australis TaxID=1399860 RepID=A0A2C5XY27_9HYPO|nr:hypothetical protein CDD81_445 [Ophiocordyceps australis]
MASSHQPAQLPPATVRQSNFEQGVVYALHLWPALTLAVTNSWGGPDSFDKRDWFAGAIVDLFPAFAGVSSASSAANEPDIEHVETVLLQVMLDEFEVNVDDDSAAHVAAQIILSRTQCALGHFDHVTVLRERFLNRNKHKVDNLFQKAQDADQDTDWESDHDDDYDDAQDDEGDEDVAMFDAPPVPKEKPPPQVDQDGFTMVAKKKR